MASSLSDDTPGLTLNLDLRDLEPPEPMMRILAALQASEPGTELVALLARKPVFLLPRIEETGYPFSLEEQDGGDWELRVRIQAGS